LRYYAIEKIFENYIIVSVHKGHSNPDTYDGILSIQFDYPGYIIAVIW